MADFVKRIENITEFRFVYRIKDIEPDFLVTLDAKNESIDQILETVLIDSGIEYNIVEKQIFIIKIPVKPELDNNVQEQIKEEEHDILIRGQILNNQEVPLLGVNIIEKGTLKGTTTDENGNFELNATDPNPILIISYIGYERLEVRPVNQDSLKIKLNPDSSQLEEVIVVGYGTQRKIDLTGSVASVSSEFIENKPITSPDEVLAGLVAGVNISTWSGDPGAPVNVRIRGVGTAGSNAPLWVIDNVPIVLTTNVIVNTSSATQSNPLAGINPNDIESIDVLKDAASAAIYGARAANGVIIVTTKKGNQGKARVTYDGYGAVSWVQQKRKVLNVSQFIDIQRQLGRDFSNFSAEPFVDWQDAVFRNGYSQNHNLTVSGGGKKANYFISGSYLDQKGVELAQSFKRYSLKANTDVKIGKVFKVGQSLLLSQFDRTVQGEPATFAGFNAALNAPFFPIRDASSEVFGYALESPSNLNGLNGEAARGLNLVARTDPRIESVDLQARKVLGNFYGEISITDKIKFKTSVGIDYTVGAGDISSSGLPLNPMQINQSLAVQSRPNELALTTSATLSYDKTFGHHQLSSLFGFEQTKFRFNKIRLQGRDLFNPNFPSTGTTMAAANEADLWTLQGWLGRINYNYKGKYLLTANIRRDATSRFSKGFRSGVFPSLSAGWRISQDFFSQEEIINDLKLRIGWGQNGNQNTPGSFPFLTALNNNIFYVIGDDQTVVSAPAPVEFANPEITWETSSQLDLGFDAVLFGQKFNFTIDYYNKQSKDVLLGLPIPFASGFFLPSQSNIGKIKNSGIELSMGFADKIGEFEYSVGGNLTTVKNRVLDLGPITQIITGIGGQQTHRTIEGESLGHFFGYKTNGLYQNIDEANAALPDSFSTEVQPGDIRFVDINNDGQINADDRTFIGSPIPGFFYGIHLSAKYKGFDISTVLRGVGDIQVYNQARRGLESYTGASFVLNGPNGRNNFSTSVLNRWTFEGSTNSIRNPRLALGDPNGNERYSDRWVEDAAYLRIQNLQIGYTVDPQKLKKWTNDTVSHLRIYLSANNLATFTKYSGLDPEVTRGQSFQKGDFTLATGQDGGVSPQPRVGQLGISLSF
ncbi:TonB-dependent receptor [Flagellimonas flava]|uniref:TonB-linked outer membrane protein, SusC/RagA family n=1 Tax=Flagellimonas flava TaxID=570519 RepID=A0A1M5JY76_9FLAO|nr:TonB-dependent receptor [Allomuricauda flava]SHG45335.1 TonB-linked outer membrane protein, SusC/RagA family [Allomuricauda flava]